jgi:hypothetical protein
MIMTMTSRYRRPASQHCLAEIRIDNPVLLEILTHYRNKGALGESVSALAVGAGETRPYAFQMTLENKADVQRAPKSLQDVLPHLVKILDENLYAPWGIKIPRNEVQFQAMLSELRERALEIEIAYQSVSWCSNGIRPDGTPCEFVYDRGEEEDELIYGSFDQFWR